ncbi:MAG: YndM family protein [Firmicutes bacterium]|nr:YndM family protein [Bacillota bacterium]
MSKTATVLLVKFIMTFLFAAVTLGFIRGNTWGWVFLAALLGTVLNYLIGDLWILPNFGNMVASIADGLLGGLTAYIVSLLFPVFRTNFTALAIFGVLIAVGEYFFHQYLLRSEKVAP